MTKYPKRLIEIPEMRRIKRLHFVGIGGAGMCGIAEVMHNQNYEVSGSDIKASTTTARLESLGIQVFIGHDASHIEGADVIVVSSAIDRSNPEIEAALAIHLPVVRRADMLGELMRYRHSIAIAGAHGKTTTTSMLTTMLVESGLDPTYVIGGKLNSSGKNAGLGGSRYLIAEADESDASFLGLFPMAAVVTNLDEDHMETYENSFDKLKAAYLQFLHNMPFYGLAAINGDDEHLYGLIDDIARPVVTFGLQPHNDIQAIDIVPNKSQTTFSVLRKGKEPLPITINVPGEHNIYNALGAIAMATDEDVDDAAIQRALSKFAGVGRRFQRQGEWQHTNGGAITLIDDYGHHPNEVIATIKAARQAYPERRLVMIFQPHRYSRTRDCFDQFVDVLSKVDLLILLDVYSAGESLIVGADSKSLARSIRLRGSVDPILIDQGQLSSTLPQLLKGNELVITQGAGNVGQLSQELTQAGLYLSESQA